MYRHNPHTIQPAFACVTTASGAQAMGRCVAQESSPQEWMGTTIPDLTGWNRPFCPGPAHGLGTTQRLSAPQKVCAGAQIWQLPPDREQTSPEEVIAPEVLFLNTNLLCFIYWCVYHWTKRGSCILQPYGCFKLMTLFFAMSCGLGKAERPSFKCRINYYNLMRNSCL